MHALALCCSALLLAADPVPADIVGPGGLRFVEPRPERGTSAAVVVPDGTLLHTAQIAALGADGRVVAPGDAERQSRRVLDDLAALLRESGADLDRVVKLNVFGRDQAAVDAARKVLAERFAKQPPAVACVTGALPREESVVVLDAVALVAEKPEAVVVRRSQRLAAAHPRATHLALMPAGARVYVSGQAEPGTDTVEAARKTMQGLRDTLRFLKLEDRHVVQVKAFLKPMSAALDVERAIVESFGDVPAPPVACVEWTLDAPIEIELVAWAGPAVPPPAPLVEYLAPPALKPSPIFSRIVRVHRGPSVYTAGLSGTTGQGGTVEVRDVFAQLGSLLDRTGSDLRHLVKATYFVSDDDCSRQLNAMRPEYYDPQRPPAASKVGVPTVARPARGLLLDMIAVPRESAPK